MNIFQRFTNYTYSLWFCLRYLPLKQAIRIPLLVKPFIKIGELHRGDIILPDEVYRGMVSWGFEGSEARGTNPTHISIHNGGKLILHGKTIILKGTAIVINGANISIGKNFLCNANCHFHATKDITIGNDCLLGWNIQLNTTDGHATFHNGIQNEMAAPITLADHVWVGADTLIFKRTAIAKGCIIAQRSLVSKPFDKPHCLIAGIPAKVVRESVDWK